MATRRARRGEPVPVLHPVLLALYPALGLYAHNVAKTPLGALVRPCLALAAVAMVLWLVLWAFMRDRYKAGVVASILVVASLSGWNVLEHGIARMPGPATTGILIVVYLALVGAAIFFSLRYRGDYAVLTRTVNWFGVVLVLLSAANIWVHVPAPRAQPPPVAALEIPEEEARQASGGSEWPDIYFIVLRGYARDDVLSAVYGYNNMPFLESLETVGVKCASKSIANYPSTLLSLASCLNMDYVQDLLPDAAPELGDLRDVVDLCHKNRVYDFLKQRGYTLIAFSPGIELLEPRANVDICLRSYLTLGEFEMVLLDTTVFARLMEIARFAKGKPSGDWRHIFDRRRCFFAFDELARIAETPADTPRFVYAYFRTPEPPFVFTRDGTWTTSERAPTHLAREIFRGTRWEYKRRYIEQLHFTSMMLRKAVYSILKSAARPPVILVVSDHGPGAEYNLENGVETSSAERFANLVLVHFPEGQLEKPVEMDETISLVNLFRLTFNALFGVGLPLKPDMAYFSVESKPLEFLPAAVADLRR